MIRVVLILILFTGSITFAQTATETDPHIPTPESVLGFKIGEDKKLAKWEQFVTYFNKVAEASNRIQVQELGKTTLKRPFIAAVISSPENLNRLDQFREIQRKLADPRLITTDSVVEGNTSKVVDDLIHSGKTIVVITCSIHSTEVGGTFTATELAYTLTSKNTPEIKQILDNVIVILVPSLNPDGTDIITNWYDKSLGTPTEGAAPPELYHHYVGHDNNRDWYAFTQVETKLTVDKILNIWHPQIIHDIHQMEKHGARFFVPPYVDPWEPNVDPAIKSGVNALGSNIAWSMAIQGKTGIVINGIYDAWTPARAYAHYHAGLRILSEAASANLATPVNIPFNSLNSGRNYDSKLASWNFPKPWPGGAWRIGDIVDYQTSAAMSLLTHAAQYRESYLRNFYEIGKRAVDGTAQDIFAFIIPEPEIPASLRDAFQRLNSGLKNVGGTDAEKHKQQEDIVASISGEPSSNDEVAYYYKTEGIDTLLSILKRGGVEVKRSMSEFSADGKKYPTGTHIVFMKQPYGAFAKALLEVQNYPDLRTGGGDGSSNDGGAPIPPYDVTAHTLPLMMNVNALKVNAPFEVNAKPEPPAAVFQSRVRTNGGIRVGLYKNYYPAPDEGWTRWMFDQYKFAYKSVADQQLRLGNLRKDLDVIIIPDQSVSGLKYGLPGKSKNGIDDDEYTSGIFSDDIAGGMGQAGIKALRDFVEAGGTIITFNRASNFIISELNLPIRNVLKDVSAKKFFCPGSILRIDLNETSKLSYGMEKSSIAWFENSPAFEVTDPARAKIIASYPASRNSLLSGWISGDNLIRGKGALVEVKVGKGRVVLFGFRPQYRGQTIATLPLLFNAILTSAF